MAINKGKVFSQGANGAARGAVVGTAGAIVSGVAISQIPVTVMWIPVATATVVAWPVAIGVGVGVAAVTGAAYAYGEYRRQKKTEDEFEKVIKGGTSAKAGPAASRKSRRSKDS